jgi:hypothetical protein
MQGSHGMAIRQSNLAVYQGDDWAATVNVTNQDGSIPNLAGYTAQSQFRTASADQDPDVAAELQCTVVPPNQISLYLDHAQTTLLEEPSYYWDLQIVSPSGDITTILTGSAMITAEVTREPVPALETKETIW